ncbi:MAG: AAA family ATPase [Acidimicrobiales bacterium]
MAAGFEAIVANIERVVHGNGTVVRLAVVCLLAEGHLLIEDIPGVGKTTLAKALAATLGCEWRRIQFTPDLLPSDVTGVTIYNRDRGDFEFRPGAVFANVVLGDEINRASPKTQAALLEAMEEGQVTTDATTYPLPRPHIVVATQNPVERQGTFPLPDGQLDRFLMRVGLGYPGRAAEMAMLATHGAVNRVGDLPAITGPDEVMGMILATRRVHVAEAVKAYILDLAEATRSHRSLALGMSPRSALALMRAARGAAAATGRDHVVPDDVKAMAPHVLTHRLVLGPEARMSAGSGLNGHGTTAGPGTIVAEVLARVPVPVRR